MQRWNNSYRCIMQRRVKSYRAVMQRGVNLAEGSRVLIKTLEDAIGPLKGLSHEIFRPVFWPVWMHLGLNVNRLWFLILKRVLWFYTVILSIDAFHIKPSRRFVESRKGLTTILKTCLCFWRTFSENRGISCQSFSETENDWHPLQRFSENRLPRIKKNWRNGNSVVNPSRRFYESPRRFGMKRIKT